MKPLGFRIESVPATGIFEGSPPQMFKTRDDGRRGPCVGDEAALWDALQESLEEIASLRQQLEKKGKR